MPRSYYEDLDSLRNRFELPPHPAVAMAGRVGRALPIGTLFVSTLPAVILTPILRFLAHQAAGYQDAKTTAFTLFLIVGVTIATCELLFSQSFKMFRLVAAMIAIYGCIFWQIGFWQLLFAHAIAFVVALICADGLGTTIIQMFRDRAQYLHPSIVNTVSARWSTRWSSRGHLTLIGGVTACYAVILVLHYQLIGAAGNKSGQAGAGMLLVSLGMLLSAASALRISRPDHNLTPSALIGQIVAFWQAVSNAVRYSPHPFAPGVLRFDHPVMWMTGRFPLGLLLNVFTMAMLPAAAYFPLPLLLEQQRHELALSTVRDVATLSSEEIYAQIPEHHRDRLEEDSTGFGDAYLEAKSRVVNRTRVTNAFQERINRSPEAWLAIIPAGLLKSSVLVTLTFCCSLALCICIPPLTCLTICSALTMPYLIDLRALSQTGEG